MMSRLLSVDLDFIVVSCVVIVNLFGVDSFSNEYYINFVGE